MATIIKEILIDARPDDVWDAVRDFGQVHKRLVPGFVTECRLDGDARVVTFLLRQLSAQARSIEELEQQLAELRAEQDR